MQFIDLAAQYKHLKSRIDARIQAVLDHGKYIMGPEVQELEEKLAEYVGVKYAITCANGTDALTIAMMVLGIKEGDAVFCPTFTFFATAETIAFAGATPVFVDVDERTFNICPKSLEAAVLAVQKEGKLNLKGVVAVDLFGLPANYPVIEKVCEKYGLKLIEDAAQGFGGSINGKRAGSFGSVATTSFFPAKPLGCYGDGGAIFTNNDEYAELIRSYRVHGKGADKYDNIRIGVNSRLDTIQAAILLEKLAEFPVELISRNEFANTYTDNLKNIYLTPLVPEGFISSWAQYTLLLDNRDELMAALKEQDISSVVYYERCMHKQTAFGGYKNYVDMSVAEALSRTVLSLPMHPYIKEDSIEKVITCAS